MLTIVDEIRMLEREIDSANKELDKMDPNDPDNRFKYANKKSEINHLYSKLYNLRQRQKDEKEKDYPFDPRAPKKQKMAAPYAGDIRYHDYPNKNALDRFRLMHYDVFQKDVYIENFGEEPMFSSTSPMISKSYFIRDNYPITYRLMFRSINDGLEINPDASIAASIPTEILLSENADKNIKTIVNFMKQYTGSPINFIVSDHKIKHVTFAHLNDSEFSRTANGKKAYYDLLRNILEGNPNNVIYIGHELTLGASDYDVINVANDFAVPSRKITIKESGIPTEERLKAYNDMIKEKILSRQ